MKKIISLILCLSMVFGIFNVVGADENAKGNPFIEIADMEVNSGDEITVPVVITGNTNGIITLSTDITYDSSLLTYTGFEQNIYQGMVVVNANEPGTILQRGMSTSNYYGDGALITYKFKVNDTDQKNIKTEINLVVSELYYITEAHEVLPYTDRVSKSGTLTINKTNDGTTTTDSTTSTTETTTETTTTETTTKAATTTKPTTQTTTTTETTTETTTAAKETTTETTTVTKETTTETTTITKETTTETTTAAKETTTETTTVTKEETTTKATTTPTETTTKAASSPTETTTKATAAPTETTTKTPSSSSGGGGSSSGKGSSRKSNTTTATTEAATETTTEVAVKEESTKPDTKAPVSSEVRITIGSKNVILGDKTYTIDAAPYIQASSNSALVPLRFVSVALLGEDVANADTSKLISWDAATKTATVNVNNKIVKFTAGSPYMIIDGKSQLMENNVKAEIKDGRMYIPFRALGTALGVKVDWEAETKTAIYKVQ